MVLKAKQQRRDSSRWQHVALIKSFWSDIWDRDPDVRYMPNGGAVANLTLYVETWRDKQTGDARKTPEWHRVVMFGKLAEVAENTCVKRAQVSHRGQMRTVAGRTISAPRATSPRCWSGRAAPCRCSAVVVEMVSPRAPRRSSPRSRRVQPLRHNPLTLRLNPRKAKGGKNPSVAAAPSQLPPQPFPDDYR